MPKSETFVFLQKSQLPIGLSIKLYLFLKPWKSSLHTSVFSVFLLLTKKPIFQLWFCTRVNLALSARWPAMCFKRWKGWSRRSWWSSSALMLLPMTSLGPLRPWLCPRCFTFIQVVAHHQSQRLLRILQPPPLQPSVFESSLELSIFSTT